MNINECGGFTAEKERSRGFAEKFMLPAFVFQFSFRCVAHLYVRNNSVHFLNHGGTETGRNTAQLCVLVSPWFLIDE